MPVKSKVRQALEARIEAKLARLVASFEGYEVYWARWMRLESGEPKPDEVKVWRKGKFVPVSKVDYNCLVCLKAIEEGANFVKVKARLKGTRWSHQRTVFICERDAY